MKRKHLILLLCFLGVVALAVVGCQKATPTPSPTPTPIAQAQGYVGSEACKTCHQQVYDGFMKTKHMTAFKPLSDYNITDLPKQITVFDADTPDNPKSTTIDLSKAYGVMMDDYIIAPVDATAGFKSETYRVASLKKEGDKYTVAAASTGDYNKDGTQDWGASNYTCGSCHSPGLGKSDKELSIGCESCHGPGSAHIAADNKAGTMKVSQDACMECHPSTPTKNATSGVWEAANHYGTRNYFASKHAASKQTNNCLTCHDPHSVNKDGLTVIGDNPVKDNCSKCHPGNSFNLDTLMWKNATDAHGHVTHDHSFGAMPLDKYGDDKNTKPLEITNPDYVKLIEANVPKS